MNAIFPLLLLAAVVAPAKAAPATQKTIADLDRAVLETVFADLLTSADTPVAARKNPPGNIRVADEAASWKITAEQVLRQHDKKSWSALSPAQLDAARQAADDLVRRHEGHDTFAPFTPSDPRVQRVSATTRPATRSTRSTRSTTRPLAEIYDRPIRAWSPGYAADRKFAVVQLSIPWSMHHADGTYLLKWDDAAAKWVVVLRQFIYYV